MVSMGMETVLFGLKLPHLTPLCQEAKCYNNWVGVRMNHGWQEVTVPTDMDWGLSGISVKLPISEWQKNGCSSTTGTIG